MFTIETAALGIVGVLLGSVVGVIAAPALAAPLFTTLLGSPAVAADPRNLAVAALPILFVLIAGSWLSTRRWSRLSVVEAIRAGTARPGKRSRLARLADRASASLAVMLGLKDLLARRGRTVLLVTVVAATTCAVVFAVCMQATLAARDANEASDVPSELPALVYTLDAILISIVVTTLVAVALLAVRERVRDFGVLRTVGFTPHQVSSSLVGAHAVVAVRHVARVDSARRRALHRRLRARRRRQQRPRHRAVVVARVGPRRRGRDGHRLHRAARSHLRAHADHRRAALRVIRETG